MVKVLDAVYENGVLKPLVDLGLAEHQRVVLEIWLPSKAGEESALEAWQQVYEGLSEEDIAEVEAIALNRSGFLREQP
jgi:predicted DNA-binding antitoxin AbrB/MazE fold protein